MYKDKSELVIYMPKDHTEQELIEFFNAVSRTGLDPAMKQIAVLGKWDKRVGRMVNKPVVLIDGFRSIAEAHQGYQGQSGPFWCGPDGTWKDVWVDSKPPVAAKVSVFREGFQEPLSGVARYEGYKQLDKDNNVTPIWSKLCDVMIAKCAEAIALRRAFPQKLGGIYIAEELQQAGFDEAAEAPNPKITDIKKKQEEKKAEKSQEKQAVIPPAPPAKEEPKKPEPTEAEKAYNAEMLAKTHKLLTDTKEKEEEAAIAKAELEKAKAQARADDEARVLAEVRAQAEADAKAAEEELMQIEQVVKEDLVCAPCVKCGCEVTGFLRSGQSKVQYSLEKLGAVYCDTHGREEADKRRKAAQAAA